MHTIIRSLAFILLAVGTVAAETRESFHEADKVFPKRRCVAEFVNAVPHGRLRAYDMGSKLILTEDYVRGQVHGKRVCYYPSGKKLSEMTFVRGLAEGLTTTWYEDGTVASTDHLKNGVPHGLQTLFYRNGKKSVETPHINAVTHGTCRHYLPDGRLFGLSTFEDGIEAKQQIIIEPSRDEYLMIVEAAKFSSALLEHWPSEETPLVSTPVPQKSQKQKQQQLKGPNGNQVEVEWKGSWYPAQVLHTANGEYRIHYTGYSDSWDETVTQDRIRPVQR